MREKGKARRFDWGRAGGKGNAIVFAAKKE
jgi:hypothetical protein